MDEKEKKIFKDNLERFASKWVGKIAVPIMVQSEEMYKDKVFVHLVNLWAENSTSLEKRQTRILQNVTDPWWVETFYGGDIQKAIEDYADDYMSRRVYELETAIHSALEGVYNIS